jgi:hypothetical protein
MTPTLELISQTKELWNQGKKVMIQVAYNLLKIREGEEWKQYGHDSFQKFAQDELDIPQSQTSKLLIIGEYFLKEYTPEQIGPCDYERLYSAAKLEGTVEENLAKARTWSRDDFKQSRAEEIGEHEAKWVTYCDVCKKAQSNHP